MTAARATTWRRPAGRFPRPVPRQGKEVDVDDPARALQRAIYNGRQEAVIPLVQKLLEEKRDVLSVINEGIIPALETIGEHFAQGEAYLPQLILAGDAAKKAFDFLKDNFPGQRTAQGVPSLSAQ